MTVTVPQEERAADKVKHLSDDYQGNKRYVAGRLLEISQSLADITKRVGDLERTLPKVEIKHFEERVREYIQSVEGLRQRLATVENFSRVKIEKLEQDIGALTDLVLPKEVVDSITHKCDEVLGKVNTIEKNTNLSIHALTRTMMAFCDQEIQRCQTLGNEFRKLKDSVEQRMRLSPYSG